MTVVADSGPLMALAKLGVLGLLGDLFGEVLMPTAVHAEVVTRGLEMGYLDAYAVVLGIQHGYLRVAAVADTDLPPDIVALPLDAGEKQCLFLAQRVDADLVVMDEALGREHASSRGLVVKGTVGVIVSALRANLLTRDEAGTLLRAIIARDDIWISAQLCQHVLSAL